MTPLSTDMFGTSFDDTKITFFVVEYHKGNNYHTSMPFGRLPSVNEEKGYTKIMMWAET